VPAELTEPQADALRELTNVAAGHAARALSTLLGGEKFGLWPPLVRLLDAPQLTALLGGRGTRLTSVGAELRGDVGGAMALVFTEPHVQTLTSRLLGAAGQRFQTPEVALRDARTSSTPPRSTRWCACAACARCIRSRWSARGPRR
jgi:chemotaxis protein CheY-P-specific phosphatase CheC